VGVKLFEIVLFQRELARKLTSDPTETSVPSTEMATAKAWYLMGREKVFLEPSSTTRESTVATTLTLPRLSRPLGWVSVL